MYTAVVLDEASQEKLKEFISRGNFPGWKIVCHHMTINIGPATNGPGGDYLGKTVSLTGVQVGGDAFVNALKVECEVPSINKIKHVTLAVNEARGGKAKMSNDITFWVDIEKISLQGVVMEVD